uniref:Uncharacterized protein n=1 Tax=Ananas comosus var. bracteatus TaxID=296719 RepID=A0A6V7NF10_ANACO|nr:unnamed protein product [Ananas comosus var. bracteatus]
MSLAHGNPLRRPIPHGEYKSRWPSPECQLVGSDPHKHVRMSTMASSHMSYHKKTTKTCSKGEIMSTHLTRRPKPSSKPSGVEDLLSNELLSKLQAFNNGGNPTKSKVEKRGEIKTNQNPSNMEKKSKGTPLTLHSTELGLKTLSKGAGVTYIGVATIAKTPSTKTAHFALCTCTRVCVPVHHPRKAKPEPRVC